MEEFNVSPWGESSCDHEMEERRRQRTVKTTFENDETILIVEDIIEEQCCHCSHSRKRTEKVRKERVLTETIETFK